MNLKHLLCGSAALLASFAALAENDPLNAVVKLEISNTQPNYFIPWQNRQGGGSGSGVVIPGNRILTNAHNVADSSLISIRKQNEDSLFVAKVEFVDHDCDLALLTVDDPKFFADITPFEVGETPPTQSQVLVAGFPMGGDGISLTQGIISRIEVQSYVHSLKDLLAVQLDAAINPGNSGGPVLYNGKIAGIAFQCSRDGDGLGYMIPTEIIQHFFTDIKDGKVDGFGSLGIVDMPLENPAARAFLKMRNDQTGIMIRQVLPGTDKTLLQVNDVILAIDGKTIANNGNIRLPDGQPRNFSVITSQKQIGEKVSLTILRDGKLLTSEVPVRRINGKVHDRLYDRNPEYYMTGGLVFTKLSISFLDEWEKNPPAKLMAMFNEENENPDEEVVVLTTVLADEVNIGYHNFWATQIVSVNGVKVKNLKHLIELMENCKDEFVTLMFSEDSPMILDVQKMRGATKRIMERYRVPADRHLND